jgi:hypothetical protein
MTQPTPVVMRGYRCECRTHHPAKGEAPALLGSIDVETAPQAVRWLRVALRTISPALGSDAFEEAWQWLSEDHHDTLQTLAQGEPFTLTLRQGVTTIQWTAHPVRYLTLATRQGLDLPACTEEYNEPRRQRE